MSALAGCGLPEPSLWLKLEVLDMVEDDSRKPETLFVEAELGNAVVVVVVALMLLLSTVVVVELPLAFAKGWTWLVLAASLSNESVVLEVWIAVVARWTRLSGWMEGEWAERRNCDNGTINYDNEIKNYDNEMRNYANEITRQNLQSPIDVKHQVCT